MPILAADLRNLLEKTVISAREKAESAAQAALVTLAVEKEQAFNTLTDNQRQLRVALRAMARQLGGGNQTTGMPLLVQEIAYHQWHRLLFARFLAENGLLMHPQGVAVSLQDCAELAREEGAADAWELAARYTGLMLPGLFATDDPAAQVRLAPEDRHALENLVQELPKEVFTADDSLGWVYQYWQTRKKERIIHGERKIGGADIGPVTQLFTEDYMVRFLLDNTLGAWWAARHPYSPLVKSFAYLRFRDDGTPAAGTYPGWPEHAAQVTVMDPCGGSGHFIIAAFDMLYRMRLEEEGLDIPSTVDAVISDNLFMLELDLRCTQIGTFSLLMAAWKASGYRDLPVPNIACSGIAVEGQLEDWIKLANGNSRQRVALERLYNLFRQASTLGSLIDPTHVPIEERMFSADYEDVAPLIEQALQREHNIEDPVAVVMGRVAQGVARAARLLARKYTLVVTNVPYLARGKQSDILKAYCDLHYSLGKNDLATAFLERCRLYAAPSSSYAVVTPQNWWFLGSYKKLRTSLLSQQIFNMIAALGSKAFQTPMWDFNVGLSILTNTSPDTETTLTCLDASDGKTPINKVRILCESPLRTMLQANQLNNQDARVLLQESHISHPLLSEYAESYWGLGSGDAARFTKMFWEPPQIGIDWECLQVTFISTDYFRGREQVVFWQHGTGDLYELAEVLKDRLKNIWRRGSQAWGRHGVAISQMGNLNATLYTGEIFQNGVAAIVPKDTRYLPAIWAFCSSIEFRKAVRRIDQKLSVTNATLIKVPFDLSYWQGIADRVGPLPVPHSNTPTQWLFEGYPVNSTDPLQVAVARLLSYRWPQQNLDILDGLADGDGIVCLPSVVGEQPAAERLRVLLATAYGEGWSQAVQQQLLTQVGFKDQGLDEWLRDGFFAQHCKLFHNRPFIWHIWDGRKDGFGALVNYHRLDAPTLDKLIYTYLGNWIETQRAERERGVSGADGRLVAALELKRKLELIRDGESPYDIYVRWKPLNKQAIGWNPDLNDGVRLNIRPFEKARVLRSKFTINWNKDRGKNPDGSERINERNFTRAEKWAARESNEVLKAGTR